MEFQAELTHTLNRVPSDLSRLSELIDPAWIVQTLHATGKASIRRRKLPAEHVVWLVIGLALFRNLPIWHVVRQLDLTLDNASLPAPSAAIQARQRLGDAHAGGVADGIRDGRERWDDARLADAADAERV